MARKSFASLILLLVLLATASASLTEVRQDFLNQTATFAPTSVMTAPTADGTIWSPFTSTSRPEAQSPPQSDGQTKTATSRRSRS